MAKLTLWLALLMLPTAVYVTWFMIAQRRRLANDRGEAPHWWDKAPWPWLLLIGVVLVAIGLGAWALNDGIPAGQAGSIHR